MGFCSGDARTQLPQVALCELARFRLNYDNHLQAAMILSEVVFQRCGIAAFACGIVHKADKSLAILV